MPLPILNLSWWQDARIRFFNEYVLSLLKCGRPPSLSGRGGPTGRGYRRDSEQKKGTLLEVCQTETNGKPIKLDVSGGLKALKHVN